MTRDDLPRLSDADRNALPDHAVIAGTIQGEAPDRPGFRTNERHARNSTGVR